MNKEHLDKLTAALRTAGFQIDNLSVEIFSEIEAIVKSDIDSDNETTITDIVQIKDKIEKRYQAEELARRQAAMPPGMNMPPQMAPVK